MPTAAATLIPNVVAEQVKQAQLVVRQQQALQLEQMHKIFASAATQRAASQGAKVPTAPPPQQTIEHQVFLQHMQTLQAHYQQAPITGASRIELFKLPAALTLPLAAVHPVPAHGAVAPASGTTSLAGAKAVDDCLEQCHKETLSFATAHFEGICAAASGVAKSSNTQEFVQKMEELCTKAKADHDARLDKLFSQLQALGTAHPDQRGRILTVTNHAGGFLGNLIIDAVGVARSAGSIIKSAAHTVVSGASTVVQKAGDWVGGAAKSIGHFFGSLF